MDSSTNRHFWRCCGGLTDFHSKMTPLFRTGFLVTTALIALVAGHGVSQWVFRSQDPEPGAVLADFSLPDLRGKTRWLSEWQGRTIVLNFWATWCAPCREEIPLFIEFQKRYEGGGLQIVGIAIDNQTAVAEYAKTMRINYPLLLAEEAGISIMSRYGNTRGGLPYTVIISHSGAIISRKLGSYKEKELETLLKPLVKLDSAAILSK